MINLTTSQPLKDAVDMLTRKVPVGSAMSSREWEALQAEIKLRAMFSARVENERLLEEMRSRLQVRIELAKKDGRTMDRGVFIEEMREELRKAGYKRGEARRGSVQDLKSSRRLGLIWDMNVAQAQGYARWKSAMTPEGLETEPCYELIRTMGRMEVRPWPVIWGQAGGEFYDGPGSNDDYPNAPGRMIAKKTDPIWTRISRFGTPWPPFDWGSGMSLRGIDRDEADAFGITTPDEQLAPLDTPFNAETKASVKGIPEAGRKRILDALAGDVEIVGDEIRIIPPERSDAMGGRGKQALIMGFDGVNQAAPKPDGTPLVEVVRVAGSNPVAQAIRQAILAADSVHGDGILPRLEVRVQTPLFNPEKAGDYQPIIVRSGTPILRINPNAISPEFATLHELGHLMDNVGLHTPTERRLYASEGQPELKDVMQAIRRSTAAGRLAAQVPAGSYLLRAREFFARAYAQFIAALSGSANSTDVIRAIREGKHEGDFLFRHSQWSWADFNEISRALARLFKKGGWKSDQ
jgi:hypothetical protein